MMITRALVATVAVAAAGSLGAPIAAADDLTTTTIGNEATLTNGDVVQGWTIGDLKPSADQIPYPVAGTLWEATATDQAIQGSVTPIVSNLNARAKDGQTYRVLFGVATPQGVNPSTLGQGAKTSGKVYFDVVGDAPDSVVYNAGGKDLLVWVQPPPQLPTRPGGGSYTPSSPATTGTPAATPSAVPGAPAGAAGTATPAVLPAGSQGTPLPAGSQGTPLPAGSQGTPVPAAATPLVPVPVGTEGAPQPASVQEGVTPGGSQGTPLPAGTATATPAPSGAQAPSTAPAASPAAPTTTVVLPPPA